jgi:chorismate mutase
MQRLRRQVDKIDLKLLKLLQQRTKLSGEIGRAKRRHGAEIYVPDREREVFARVASLAGKGLPGAAVTAIFREILSSSRAAQGQAPIGFLQGSAQAVQLQARWHFGACDRFVTKKRWRELEAELAAGRIVVALLTTTDLAEILGNVRTRKAFLSGMIVVGEISMEAGAPLAAQTFIVKPKRKVERRAANRALILIECKITANAVKSLLTAMPYRPIHAEHVSFSLPPGRAGAGAGLLSLTFSQPIDTEIGELLSSCGVTTSVVGIFPGSEVYGG